MNDAAIIEAEYVEWKMVKTRKALQLIFEVPLEKQSVVLGALGVPLPDISTPVAITRLRPEAVKAEPVQIAPPEPRRQATLAQIAGILCNEGAFQRFVGAANADEAAEYIRGHCAVASRRELDTNEDAAATFRGMRGEYELWMRGGEAA